MNRVLIWGLGSDFCIRSSISMDMCLCSIAKFWFCFVYEAFGFYIDVDDVSGGFREGNTLKEFEREWKM